MKNQFNICGRQLEFLILIDFSKVSYKTLEFSIKLAKSVNGRIELFCICNSTEITSGSSAVSVLQNIALESKKIGRRIEVIIEMIEVEKIPVKFSYSYGNQKYELKYKTKYLKSYQILVINKSQEGLLHNSYKYLVDEYKGNLLILNNSSDFNIGKTIIVKMSKSNFDKVDIKIPKTISYLSNSPLKILFTSLYCEKNVENDLEAKILCVFRRKEEKQSFLSKLFNRISILEKIVSEIEQPLLILRNTENY